MNKNVKKLIKIFNIFFKCTVSLPSFHPKFRKPKYLLFFFFSQHPPLQPQPWTLKHVTTPLPPQRPRSHGHEPEEDTSRAAQPLDLWELNWPAGGDGAIWDTVILTGWNPSVPGRWDRTNCALSYETARPVGTGTIRIRHQTVGPIHAPEQGELPSRTI